METGKEVHEKSVPCDETKEPGSTEPFPVLLH